jgi:hypothetical protein
MTMVAQRVDRHHEAGESYPGEEGGDHTQQRQVELVAERRRHDDAREAGQSDAKGGPHDAIGLRPKDRRREQRHPKWREEKQEHGDRHVRHPHAREEQQECDGVDHAHGEQEAGDARAADLGEHGPAREDGRKDERADAHAQHHQHARGGLRPVYDGADGAHDDEGDGDHRVTAPELRRVWAGP